MELREAALKWAGEILGTRWEPARFRLECRRERVGLWAGSRAPRYVAFIRVWEQRGRALVSLDRAGALRGVRYPVEEEQPPPEAAALLSPREEELASQVALAEVAREQPAGKLRVRAQRCWRRRGLRLVSVALEGSADDAWIKVELDAFEGRRLGYLCQPFARGSARSAALSRASALRKAREALALPSSASLSQTRLVTTRSSRLWILEWTLEGQETISSRLNARTGWRVGWRRSGPLESPATEGSPPLAREVAVRTLRLAASLRLGAACRLGAPVLGVRQAGRRTAPVWLAALEGPRGEVYWASVGSGPVRFKRIKAGRRRA